MTINELREHLEAIGISPNTYSIGSEADNRLVIMEVLGRGTWQVSFSERGECLDYKTFQKEAEACAYFLQQMNPTTFQPKLE